MNDSNNNNNNNNNERHGPAPEITKVLEKTSSAGEGTKKRSAGLLDGEACADEDDEEDDRQCGGSRPPVLDTTIFKRQGCLLT